MKLTDDGKVGLEDLFFFGKHFFNLDLEEQPHRKMCDTLMAAEFDKTKPYSMLIVPRGTFKTSLMIAASVWRYLRRSHLQDNPYHRTIVASATLSLGQAVIQGIEGVVRYGGWNGRLDDAYGPLWKNRDHGSAGSKVLDGINFAPRLTGGSSPVKEPSVFIGSLRRISTGFHADDAIMDDINNDENVKTDHQRKKTHDYYRLVFPIIEHGIFMAATPWHDDDVRGMIIREEAARERESDSYKSPWNILQQSIFLEDGSSFFPKRYPLEKIETLRRDMGTRQFSANYLCDPVGTNGFVQEDQIKFKPKDGFPSLKHIRICVDPNQHNDAKELGCYAAIVVAGYDAFGKMYVLDARGSREWNTNQFISALVDVQEEYPFPIYMEDSHMTHFQAAVAMEETSRSDAAGHLVRMRINYVPVDYKSSKYERWQRIQPRFNNSSIFFSDDIAPSIKVELKDELVRGEVARFKDFLDALSMCEIGYRPRVGRDGKQQEVLTEAPSYKKRAPHEYTFGDALGDKWKDIM